MKAEFVPDLMAGLGMTEREAKLYVAMLEKPEWKSGELHRITGVPRVQTHQTLELMVSRQYCIKRSEGRYNHYRATPPEVLHDIVTKQWKDEVDRKINRADSITGTLGDIYKMAMKEDRSLDFIEIVQTPHRIHNRFLELITNAKEEGLAFNRSPYSFMVEGQNAEKHTEQAESTADSYERGVKCRSIFMYEEDTWDILKPGIIEEDQSPMDDVRISDYLPGKMFVFDRKTTMINITSIASEGKSGFNQIIIHDTSFAAICADVFEMYWAKAKPYKDWVAE